MGATLNSLTTETADELPVRAVTASWFPAVLATGALTGKVVAARYAREHDISLLWESVLVCRSRSLNLHAMCWVFLKPIPANSSLMGQHPVIDLMPDQTGKPTQRRHHAVGRLSLQSAAGHFLGTGLWLRRDYRSATAIAMNSTTRYREYFRASMAWSSSGTSPDGRHGGSGGAARGTFYVGVQFHPEFKSRPNRRSPAVPGNCTKAAASRQK